MTLHYMHIGWVDELTSTHADKCCHLKPAARVRSRQRAMTASTLLPLELAQPPSNHTRPQHLHIKPSANSALAALMYPTCARHLGGRNPPNIPRECNQSAQYHLVNPRSQWLHPNDAHRVSNTELVMGQRTRHVLHHTVSSQTRLYKQSCTIKVRVVCLPSLPRRGLALSVLRTVPLQGGDDVAAHHSHTYTDCRALSWCRHLQMLLGASASAPSLATQTQPGTMRSTSQNTSPWATWMTHLSCRTRSLECACRIHT